MLLSAFCILTDFFVSSQSNLSRIDTLSSQESCCRVTVETKDDFLRSLDLDNVDSWNWKRATHVHGAKLLEVFTLLKTLPVHKRKPSSRLVYCFP